MTRQPIPPDDTTPLDGPEPDVGARIAWLLQINRLVGDRTLRQMAEELSDAGFPCHASTLSRVEQSGTLDTGLIRGYEVVLGVSEGALTAATDMLARSFPRAHDLRSREPDLPPDPYRLEARLDAVERESPTGADWLWLAVEHQAGQPFGLPPRQLRPLVDRLLSEMVRGVGFAFTTRYNAVSRLRAGLYGRVVLEAIRDLIEAPYVPFSGAILSALGEAADEPAFAWCLDLVGSDDAEMVRAARLCLTTFVVLDTFRDAWGRGLLPAVTRAARAADPDSAVLVELGRLVQALPPAWRQAYARSGGPRLPQPRRPEAWSRSRTNRHFALAERLARQFTTAAGLSDQPLLARLLFEVLYDHRPERVANASYLLMASPLAPAIHAELVRLAMEGDEVTREGARTAVIYLHRADIPPRLEAWLASGDRDLQVAACMLAGVAGAPLDAQTLLAWSEDPDLHGHVLTAAGMAQLPVLDRLPDIPGPAAPDGSGRPLGDAARWWRHHGGVVRE